MSVDLLFKQMNGSEPAALHQSMNSSVPKLRLAPVIPTAFYINLPALSRLLGQDE